MERNFSFIFADEVSFIEMKKAVTELAIAEGDRPASSGDLPRRIDYGGKYSVLLRVRFQSSGGRCEMRVAQWSWERWLAVRGWAGCEGVVIRSVFPAR